MLFRSVDPVEKIGIERAWQQLEQADAVLLLSDITRRDDADHQHKDGEIEAQLRKRLPASAPVIRVLNKVDALNDAAPPAGDALALSAKTGAGLDELKKRLLAIAGWDSAVAEGVFMARERHLVALRAAYAGVGRAAEQISRQELFSEELRLAHEALMSITGEVTPDDLLGEIFSRFCIGK